MKIIYFLINYAIFITNVYGFSDQELVISLQSFGEWEEAYRYANNSALKTKIGNLIIW